MQIEGATMVPKLPLALPTISWTKKILSCYFVNFVNFVDFVDFYIKFDIFLKIFFNFVDF